MNLVIVESPAKAKKIQGFLGKDYTVKSSFGHIRDLSEKSLGIDIPGGFKPEYIVPADKKKVVTELKTLAGKADRVFLASDEDREGEAIAWHLFEVLGLKKEKTCRITFHEITKNAILEAVKNPRDIDMDMVGAQQARRVLDRLVGFELSPVLWKKIQPKLSAGRVQSVALRLIVDREREILGFHGGSAYRIEGLFLTADGHSLKATLDKRPQTLEEARAFLEHCAGADWNVLSLESKEASRCPAPPFTTSTLQQEAARKCHFSVNQTMNLAQRLYEEGHITYMRTDSTNLSSLALGTARKHIVEKFGEAYSHTRQYRTHSAGAQEAHEAIRPTYIDRPNIEGTAQEKRLYELIWKRTVASQMEDARVLRTEGRIGSSRVEGNFVVNAERLLFDGFLKLYLEGRDDETEEEGQEQFLPDLKVGDALSAREMRAACKYAQPPLRYSEASLVKKLEELGIGRPSTYATIITTLTKARGYVVKGDKEGVNVNVVNLRADADGIREEKAVERIGGEKGKLIPQDIGMIVSDYLVGNFSDIMDYRFTAKVESDFDEISKGDKTWNCVIADFYSPFHQKVDSALSAKDHTRVERDLGVDENGRRILARFGQFGPYIQAGEGADRVCVSLAPGQLIESISLEEALKLFTLPRTVGQYQGQDIVCRKGRFGPYFSWGEMNVSLPRGVRPESVSLEKCIELIQQAQNRPAKTVLLDFGSIQVLNGAYGPYIKSDGKNYRIPKGTDAATLTVAACQKIIDESTPSAGRKRRFSKK